jgi:hypothetical protein
MAMAGDDSLDFSEAELANLARGRSAQAPLFLRLHGVTHAEWLTVTAVLAAAVAARRSALVLVACVALGGSAGLCALAYARLPAELVTRELGLCVIGLGVIGPALSAAAWSETVLAPRRLSRTCARLNAFVFHPKGLALAHVRRAVAARGAGAARVRAGACVEDGRLLVSAARSEPPSESESESVGGRFVIRLLADAAERGGGGGGGGGRQADGWLTGGLMEMRQSCSSSRSRRQDAVASPHAEPPAACAEWGGGGARPRRRRRRPRRQRRRRRR